MIRNRLTLEAQAIEQQSFCSKLQIRIYTIFCLTKRIQPT